MKNNTIYSIAISARALMNLHSLNNEGGEGNQIQTRMAEIIYYDKANQVQRDSVNAISGDMLKYIQSEHLYRIAKTRNLPMCEPCRRFDTNRISADTSYLNEIVNKNNEESINLLLKRCAITDMEGVLITKDGAGKNRSLPRKSVAEFAWAIGVPGAVITESYFHVKYESERGERVAATDESGTVSGKQTPFHRPASSGVYAIVCNFDIARISYNDISQTYPPEIERTTRYQALLESILYTFIQMNGAMRSTQMPHLLALHGVVAVSRGVLPAPTISPLNSEFADEIQRTKDALNRLHKDPELVQTYPFQDLAGFTDVMGTLIQTTVPYELKVGIAEQKES